ncbi:Nitrilotriacetate monooxygenase component B [Candidatus Rhodobacter oscarellae]|uniref:Nitrilotriacetate monooxygenase component B n=1 Tax=Candidatus Rhodobacter oscarellae TaxID=1675527 RepID=A0A0J9EA50_9RHOB|nr:flavin reductase family protein [Candidatus Rhodobacter lobularis]KMW58549.1 Nitrilotriacetate monooxygenase component B [Candidatus Rhodobacter lobularis]
MFYRPEDGHGLPHNPFNAIITPRPIGWISSQDAGGRANLAPYSFFNGVAYEPPQVMFACTSGKPDRAEMKDSVANIVETGVFCVNIVAEAMRDAMNTSAGIHPMEVDEFELAGLEKAQAQTVDCPYVAGAPAVLECKLTRTVQLPGAANTVVFGEVTGIHLRDDCVRDGKFDILAFNPLARLGYRDYTTVTELFSLKRPGE